MQSSCSRAAQGIRTEGAQATESANRPTESFFRVLFGRRWDGTDGLHATLRDLWRIGHERAGTRTSEEWDERFPADHRHESRMPTLTHAREAFVNVCLISAIMVTQIGAAPQHESYVTSWYLHAQRLVDVGGRHLNILCMGTGSPVVVLDAGLGNGISSWRYVQRPISRHTRVCSYDRAGMGFSEPTLSARDAGAIVNDMHSLLRAAGIAPPYVLVGHSIAGLYDVLYGDRYPHDVAGFVLVDPSTQYDDALLRKFIPSKRYSREEREQNGVYRACIANVSTCALGNVALLKKSLKTAGCPQANPSECAVNEGVHMHEFVRPLFFEDVFLELLAAPYESTQEVHDEQRQFGKLPFIVLSAGYPDPDATLTSSQRYAMWVDEVHLQERVAALSSSGVHYVVDGSGHYIQKDRPSAVISAVDEVVDQARYCKRSSSRHSVR